MTGDSLQSYTLSPVDDSGSGSTPPGSLEVAPASHKGGTAQQNTAFCVFVLCVFVFVFVFVYLYICICTFGQSGGRCCLTQNCAPNHCFG